jgi:hypothetical protein
MNINSVISYLGAWKNIKHNHNVELNELIWSIDEYFRRKEDLLQDKERFLSSTDVWNSVLSEKGWESLDGRHFLDDGRRIYIGHLGSIKNGIAAQISFGNPSWFHRWLFTQSVLAIRYGFASVTVLLCPTKDHIDKTGDKPYRNVPFEYIKDQLDLLSPLSNKHPFLIIGYSSQPLLFDPVEYEIPSDPNITTEKVVIDRSIEFPPEYHQAGLGILNYFSTYLMEKYPGTTNTVRIEQCGLVVRLIIESEDGKQDIVEKALQEYELIVTGKTSPETYSPNDKVLLEIKNELRIAQFRVESQNDIIQLQNHRIDQLLNIVGDGLRNRHNHNVCIDFKPNIVNENTVNLCSDISLSLGLISELIGDLPTSSEAATALKELEGSLESIENETDHGKVKTSPALSKFRRIIDKLSDEESSLRKSFDVLQNGVCLIQELAKRYNGIAQWCGLPVVPDVFLK